MRQLLLARLSRNVRFLRNIRFPRRRGERLLTGRYRLPLAVGLTAAATVVILVVTLLVGGAVRPFGRPAAGADPVTAAAMTRTCAGQRVEAPRQLRGMWITTVSNSDWPSRPGLDPAAARAEYREWLELARRMRYNAVFVQVRPSGDAFWPSKYVPWSYWLTGQVAAKHPGWDPLAFLVAETHRYGLEFHAWFNPYRGSRWATDRPEFPANHPLSRHPEWAVVHPPGAEKPQLYYNPGIPAARRYVEDSILEVVERYDVDGVHFDDFFYPYPGDGTPFGDSETFAQYGKGFASLGDWRRANVNLLIKETGERIKKVKPRVKFGISPFGIWRNLTNDPSGSDTRGLSAYDSIYADSRQWVRQEWIDYIVPQIYWYIGFEIADYAKLVPWWARVVAGTRVQLYIGQADYRVGSAGVWSDPAELDRQLTFNRQYQVSGSVHFTARNLRADKLGAISRYVAAHHPTPALVPTMTHLPGEAPAAPQVVRAVRGASGAVTVRWRAGPRPAASGFAVYRVELDRGSAGGASVPAGAASVPAGAASVPAGGASVPAGPSWAGSGHLAWTGRATGQGDQSWTDPTAAPGASYAYCITALDRLGNESPISAPARAG